MLTVMVWRMASWGLAITGFLGWVLAINAALSNHYTGAGACLGASVLAFAGVRYAMRRRQ